MDKYELKVTIGEIDTLIAKRRLREAAEIADTVDWRRVKNVRTLCRVSDVYKINRRYEDSKRILELAYAKNPYGRQIIFSLCELELKLGNYVRALQLYNEYINVAPRDPDRYVLQYKLYKEQDVSVNERIAVLEEMARHDLRDRWAFELAKLYLEAGERSACASQCDEIVAFFGDGKYVLKALELKASFSELTVRQKALYRKMTGQEEEEPELPEETDGEGNGEGPSAVPADSDAAPGVTGSSGSVTEEVPGRETSDQEAPDRETTDKEAQDQCTPEQGAPDKEMPAQGAAGRETSGNKGEDHKKDAGKNEEDIPVLNREPLMTEIPWEYEDYTIRTRELKRKSPAAVRNGGSADSDIRVRSRKKKDAALKDPASKEPAGQVPLPEPDHSVFEDHTFEIGAEEEAMFSPENMQKTIARGLRHLDNYDTFLMQETDGQYAMVMQEERKPDKQIAGQLNLEEIMSEWEKVKRDFYETNGIEGDEPPDPEEIGPVLAEAVHKNSTGNTKSWDPGEVHKALEIRDDDSETAEYDTSLFVTEEVGDFPSEFVVEQMTLSTPGRPGKASGHFYLHSEDSIRQLSDALGRIFLEGGKGNVVITGDEGAGTLSLARELVRRYRKINPNFVGQIAKSEGMYITRENMLRVIPRMPFGALIIERASQMSEEGAAALSDMITVPERSILIIMIDRKGVMDAFLNDHPRLREMFPARVDIAALSVDTLLGYAREYAVKQQCEIDEYGISALQSRILSMQTVEHNVTLEDIRDIVDEAVYYASRKTFSSLVDSFSRRKGGAQNRIVLRDKDFLHY